MKFTCYFMFTFMSFLCSSWTRLLTSVPVPCAWSSGCSVSLQPPVQPWLRVLCCSNDLSLCFLLLDFGHLFTPWPALTQSFPFHPCWLAFFLFCTDFDFDLVPCSLSFSILSASPHRGILEEKQGGCSCPLSLLHSCLPPLLSSSRSLAPSPAVSFCRVRSQSVSFLPFTVSSNS